MIEQSAIEHPQMALSNLCKLFSVNRSWYYEKRGFKEKAIEEDALTDAIIDEYSRYCVGWSLSRWIGIQLTISTLQMPLKARSPARWIDSSF